MRKILALLTIVISLSIPQGMSTQAASWRDFTTFSMTEAVQAYNAPQFGAKAQFVLYPGMEIESHQAHIINGEKWLKIAHSKREYWIPAYVPGQPMNVAALPAPKAGIVDYYGILEQPHSYAVKMVKEPGAKGYIETYKRINDEYIHQNTYHVTYPREGAKNKYGDLKTVGGPVVRYLYRTTRSRMNGWHDGERFGVYKVSYPMPHDALPWLLEGRMSTQQYNRIPTINYAGNDELYPHPQGMLGADILIHTAKHGSLGCILVKNEEMHRLYMDDLVTENNKEIIPFVVYDEGMEAPKTGRLLF